MVTLCEDTDGDGLGNPGTEIEECGEGGMDITDGCDLPDDPNTSYLHLTPDGSVLYKSLYDTDPSGVRCK
jgi:hypothetical protein